MFIFIIICIFESTIMLMSCTISAGQGAIDDVLLPSFVSASSMISHYLSPAGIDAAKRVVIVIGHVSPDITFGPTIFSLVALFLHYMSEQDCFECIYNILHSEYKYVPQTRIAYEATKYILKDLAKKYVVSFKCQTNKNIFLRVFV